MNLLIDQEVRNDTSAQPNTNNLKNIIPIGGINSKLDVVRPSITQQKNKNEVKDSGELPESKKYNISDALEGLYELLGNSKTVISSTKRGNKSNDNTRLELDDTLLEELVNTYMLRALNISTAHIYNQTSIPEQFRLYDGNRSEVTLIKENGIDCVKHNVDKGEGSSNMMRILYPSSAGTLSAEGGFLEAFKRDCAPSPELMGEIVAHLYKYRKDKNVSIRKIFETKIDPGKFNLISNYLGARDEANLETGEVTTATQIREENKNNIIGDYQKNKLIFDKLTEIKRQKAIPDVKKQLKNIKITDSDRDITSKYNDIRQNDDNYVNLVEALQNVIDIRDSEEDNNGKYSSIMKIVTSQIEMPNKGESTPTHLQYAKTLQNKFNGIRKFLGLKLDNDDIAIIRDGLKDEELKNINDIKKGADLLELIDKYQKMVSLVDNTILQAGRLIFEFPSLELIRKDSFTTFVALLRNAEAMIDQESESENGHDGKIIPKYTTEQMFMLYVMNEFGTKENIKKFYSKVKRAIPENERDDKSENPYRETAYSTIDFLKKFECNKNSPYTKATFGHSRARLFALSTDERGNKEASANKMFTDCADTAVRHLINFLSYDKVNGWNYIYDEKNKDEVTKINGIVDKVLGAINDNKKISYDEDLGDRVKAFYYYQNQYGVSNTHELEGHTFWNYVISNMNDANKNSNGEYYDINYSRDKNELSSGYINLLKLVYNIAYSLKAKKGLSTANGVFYDDRKDENGNLIEGQFSKAKSAINALENDSGDNIKSLTKLLKTSFEEIFSLFNKKLNTANFIGLEKNEKKRNDIFADDNSKDSTFNISRSENDTDSLDFGLLVHAGHTEMHHTPYINKLTPEEKIKAWDINPKLMLLPDMNPNNYNMESLSLFDRLHSSNLSSNDYINLVNLEYFKNYYAMLMIKVVNRVEALTREPAMLLQAVVSNKTNITVNLSNKSDSNTKETSTNLDDYLLKKFVDTLIKSDEGVLNFVRGINSVAKVFLTDPLYKNTADMIIDKSSCVHKYGELYYRFKLEDDKAIINDVISSDEDIKIPQEVKVGDKLYPVKSVNFKYKNNLKTVELPDSIEWIEDSAFICCFKLISINIPNGVESIGESAFEWCKELKSIDIPASVKSIGNGAFRCCGNLSKVSLQHGLQSLGKGAFCNCSNLTSIDIPSGFTSISDNAFNSCIGLKSIIIPSSVKSIGDSSFRSCSSLTSVELTSGLESIGDFAFGDCIKLISINIPSSVKSIGDAIFYNCNGLKIVNIPNSITELGYSAFRGCDSLHIIELPQSLVDEDKLGEADIELSDFDQEILDNNRIRLTKKNT